MGFRRLGRDNYSSNDFYDNNDSYGFDDNQDWKQQILRTVIGNFLGGGFDGGNSLNLPIQIQQGYNEPYRTYSRPAYYDSPLYVGDGDDYPSDAGLGDSNSSLGGLLNELPIAELVSQYTGDNDFVSSLLGGLLTQGYDEGFLAGQYARNNNGDDDEYGYRDPYSYEGGICDPYSASIGRNRQLLSEGYSLGYQDALRGQTNYEPMSNGNADLVSLLLNGVLGNV